MDSTMVRRAVELALDNAAAGQLPFGALVVRDGEVLASGVNTALRDHDPAAHAEVEAVRNACRDLGELHLTGAVIYSSCQPCPMCLAVASVAGIARVYYAAPGTAVPDLRYPAPDALGHTDVELVAVDGATEPFDRYLEAL